MTSAKLDPAAEAFSIFALATIPSSAIGRMDLADAMRIFLAGARQEREACAMTAEQYFGLWDPDTVLAIANGIRERGQAEEAERWVSIPRQRHDDLLSIEQAFLHRVPSPMMGGAR